MTANRSLNFVIGAAAVALAGAAVVVWQQFGQVSRDPFALLSVTLLIAATVICIQGVTLGRLRGQQNRLHGFVHHLVQHDERAAAQARPEMQSEPATARIAAMVESMRDDLQRQVESLRRRCLEMEVRAKSGDASHLRALAVFDAMDDAVILTDAFSEVVMLNAAAGRLFSTDPRTASRQSIERIVSDPGLTKLIKDTREAAARGTLRQQMVELTLEGPTDSPIATRQRTYEVTLTSLHEKEGHRPFGCDGESTGIVTILRDVSREKQLLEMRSAFVSNVSHELRTPLSSIKAYMELLIDGEAVGEDARHEFYNIVQGEADRLTRLIENLLNISRIESGAVRAHREQFVLGRVMQEVLDVLGPPSQRKRIDLTAYPGDEDAWVHADRDMIHQAVLNLVSNAIKYTPAGGRVDVAMRTDRANGMAWVSVTDTGVGVSPADVPRLFDKFYRVADHRKLAGGTGLGLNLVKHIIETVHEGEIRVESTPGKGSTFTFGLPIAENQY